MIDITSTELNISSFIEPEDIVAKYDVPGYKLNVYPGELEDLGKPIRCHSVTIQFKNIDYEEKEFKFGTPCFVQINKINFEILVTSNNLRNHTDIYQIAQAIILELRGKCPLIDIDGTNISQQSPLQVTDYRFGKIGNGGACYQSRIIISSCFPDSYLNSRKSTP